MCISFLFIGIFIFLSRESNGAPYELAEELSATCLPHLDGVIPLSAFPNSTTSEFAGLLHAVLLILNDKQGSYEYQFLRHWLDSIRNRTLNLPVQKQTVYPPGHLIGYCFHDQVRSDHDQLGSFMLLVTQEPLSGFLDSF